MAASQSSRLKVAIIGCGRPLQTTGATGYGMAHRHMAGYRATGRCDLVAVADIHAGNAAAFVAEHGPGARVFSDYREMMAATRPDVMSVCLWPHLHAEVVCALAPQQPRAIFCEKPMEIHWDAALRMHEACTRAGVVLAINHQRRYNRPLVRAKALLDEGAIGALRRLEGAWFNLADTGSHVLDLMFFFNDDTPADWVLGQVDLRGARRVFGAVQTGDGVCTFRFRNGVRATYHFGAQHEELGAFLRLVGEQGTIEILFAEPWLRIWRRGGAGWETLDAGESIHDDLGIHRAIADLLACLDTGRRSPLDSSHALRATEIIFATTESVRRRGRVDLPLAPGPCALLSMIAAGEMVAEGLDSPAAT